ncbi:hypothetical protein B0T26DRAFT_741545 [Lasiosphaeria miniovina]|uniref:Hemerythrin-like domain-containing protein n=1 Tax=Lasiosphaeria miniovina TaxID=1954250 RepID=A0AA40AAS7_9PEZI|nr:uncharacterized protein B0T26DRAFT_741545 [Lasiosphaeria miniovina]KAK0712374.1 hypothetical protein B0T26DRAFT_741545 [Lasiosphaeria miniovina]
MARISEAIKEDHAQVRRAFHRLSETEPELRKPNDVTGFVWALERYLIAEHLVVTPALEYHVANGGDRHRRLSSDHDSMNQKLKHMLVFDPAEASFDASLMAIWVDLDPHINEETSSDLVQLEESMSQAASEALRSRYAAIKSLLQKPYGSGGVPDAQALLAILEMPREDLMAAIGLPSL